MLGIVSCAIDGSSYSMAHLTLSRDAPIEEHARVVYSMKAECEYRALPNSANEEDVLVVLAIQHPVIRPMRPSCR